MDQVGVGHVRLSGAVLLDSVKYLPSALKSPAINTSSSAKVAVAHDTTSRNAAIAAVAAVGLMCDVEDDEIDGADLEAGAERLALESVGWGRGRSPDRGVA